MHSAKVLCGNIRGHIARSNLADAEEKHDWRIYRDFASPQIVEARRLYAEDAFGADLENGVCARHKGD
jgi:hypothetical protein